MDLSTTTFGCACELHYTVKCLCGRTSKIYKRGALGWKLCVFLWPCLGPLYSDYKQKSQIITSNALLIIMLFWNATAKKSTPTLHFETRLAPRFSQNATLSPCSPSVLSSPPDPDLDRASLPPVASCLLASGLVCCGVRPAAARLSPCCARRPASLLCPPACSTSSRAPPGLQQGASRKAPPGAQQSSASLLCSLLLPAVAAWSEDPKKPRHVPQASRQQRPVLPQASRQQRPVLPPCFQGEHKRLWKN